jgi:hypothetical protein
MAEDVKAYLVIDKNFDNINILQKMIFLITKLDLSLKNEEGFIPLELPYNELTKLSVSIKTIAHDLNLDGIGLCIVPCFGNKIKALIPLDKYDFYYLYDEIFKGVRNGSIEVNKVTSILENINKETLDTIENYIRFDQSVSLTGEYMFAHRNTINYRVNKFISTSQINIRQMHNAIFVAYVINLIKQQ